jgi:mannose-6-phosphate isomerase-like protein (cupin superfamily)
MAMHSIQGENIDGIMPNRRDVLMWAAGGNAMALLARAANKLPEAVIDDKNAKLTREPFGDLRIYFDGPTDQLKSMTAGSLLLKPGMTPHAPHEHPEEEFMVVTEGTGEISVEGRITKVGPGSMMYCGAGKLHGVVNTGQAPMLFYFYKWKA